MEKFLAELQRIEQLATSQNNWAKTMALLHALKAGDVSLDNVTLTADGWKVAAIPELAPELRIAEEEPADAATDAEPEEDKAAEPEV